MPELNNTKLPPRSSYQKLVLYIRDILNREAYDSLSGNDIPPLSSDVVTKLLDLLYGCLVPSFKEDKLDSIVQKDLESDKSNVTVTFHSPARPKQPPIIHESKPFTETPQSLTRTAKFLLEKLEASEKKRQETKSPISKSDITIPVTKPIPPPSLDSHKMPIYLFEPCAHHVKPSSNIPSFVPLPKYSFD